MDEQIAADETFEALRTLEKIDHEMEAFANQLDELAPELSASGQRIAEMKARAEMLTKKADRVELRLRKFERASQAGRETLKRLQQRAQEVQNLKQHTAVRAETDAARRNLEAAEDDLLDAMQEAEEARGALAALARELSEEESAYEALESETSARRAEIEAEISVQRDRRRNREMRLDADAVRLYESVRGGKTRKVLAPLTQDGVCGHCYTFIPVQRQAEIRGASRLYLCEGCGIILYPAG
jgi:predicted  nucleic acid-binding Zn-ribbon protein